MGLDIAGQLQKEMGLAAVGWSAMRRELLAQAALENSEKGFDIPGFKTISMFNRNPPKVGLLVVDEAHHDATRSMADLHTKVEAQFTLGLTATHVRLDRALLCFDKVIIDCTIQQLIDEGYLSQYHHFTIDEYSPQSVVSTYAMDPDKWGKSVVFFHTEADCLETVRLFKRAKIAAELVTHRSRREEQLARFKSGETRVLVNMMILGEGFNAPDLKTVFVRPSSRKPTVQMAGRVFRTHPDHPFKQIVQCRLTPYPFMKAAKPAEQFVLAGTQWLSVVENRQIDQLVAAALREVIAAPVSFDPEEMREAKRRRAPIAVPKPPKPAKGKKKKKKVSKKQLIAAGDTSDDED